MHKRHNSTRTSAAARDKRKRPGEKIADQAASDAKEALVSQTELGLRLSKIRKRIVAGGRPLLGWQGIEKELLERRGEPGGEA